MGALAARLAHQLLRAGHRASAGGLGPAAGTLDSGGPRSASSASSICPGGLLVAGRTVSSSAPAGGVGCAGTTAFSTRGTPSFAATCPDCRRTCPTPGPIRPRRPRPRPDCPDTCSPRHHKRHLPRDVARAVAPARRAAAPPNGGRGARRVAAHGRQPGGAAHTRAGARKSARAAAAQAASDGTRRGHHRGHDAGRR